MHTRTKYIEFDPAKARVNQRKHGVSFADAEQALRDPLAVTLEDPDAKDEPRFVTLGMDATGRFLVVLWTSREEWVRVISARKASKGEGSGMRNEYDFSKAKRGAVIPSPGKTRITIMLDNDVLAAFRQRAEKEGRGYQTAINEALRAAIQIDNSPVTVGALRRELKRAMKDTAA